MKKLIKDLATKSKVIADYIKDLSRYLSMRDKVLWTGTLAHGQSLPLAVAQAINKYKRIRCRINISGYYGDSIFCEYRNGAYIGTAFLESWSTGAQISCQVRLLPSGSTLYLAEDSGYMTHAYKSNHSELYPLDNTGYYICAIEGVEPYMPESLKTFGGGYCLTRLIKRWCMYEDIHHLEADCNFNSKYKITHNRQQYVREWLRNISKWLENMLGLFQRSKVGWNGCSADNLFRRICNALSRILVQRILASTLQLWENFKHKQNNALSVRQSNTRQLSFHKIKWNILNNRSLIVRGYSVC